MIREIYEVLLNHYGSQGWWPINGEYKKEFSKRARTKEEQFEIAAGAILTQNTSWKNVEMALQELRKNDLLSADAIKNCDKEKLAAIIRCAGYHNQKARKLKEFAAKFEEPDRDHLLSLWGIGAETADSILLYAHNIPFFVVDTYTKRLVHRLGMIIKDPKKMSYAEVQDLFHSSLKKDQIIFNEFHALIVEHAKQHCKKTPACEGCPLINKCAHARQQSDL